MDNVLAPQSLQLTRRWEGSPPLRWESRGLKHVMEMRETQAGQGKGPVGASGDSVTMRSVKGGRERRSHGPESQEV